MRRAWRCPAPSPLCWRRASSQTARSPFRPPWCPISEPTVWFPPVADSDLRRRAGPRAVVVLALLLGGITVGYTWVVARRSEERRVGKECGAGGRARHEPEHEDERTCEHAA